MIINSIIRFFHTDNELTINKLGKFTKKHIASQLEGGQIFPPKVILEFEYNEDINGFSFVDKISQWESLRLLDADDQVTKWVKELKNAIQNNKSVSFENFGTFYMNPTGVICFDSDIIKELNSEYYGMAPVPLNKTGDGRQETGDGGIQITDNGLQTMDEGIQTADNGLQTTDEGIQTADNGLQTTDGGLETGDEGVQTADNGLQTTDERLETGDGRQEIGDGRQETGDGRQETGDGRREIEDDGLQTTEEVEEEEKEEVFMPVKKRKNRWLERLIFILIILGSIGLVAYLFRSDIKKFYDQKFNKNNQVETPTPQAVAVDTNMDEYIDYEADSLENSNSATNTSEEITNPTVSKVETTKNSNNSNTTTKPVQIETNQNGSKDISSISFEKGKFYVIAGSFGKKSDAIQHIKDKKLTQYNPVLLVGDSRVRVCIGTYKTEAEATAFAKKIDQSFWVLK